MGLRMVNSNGGSLKNKIFRGGEGGHENSMYSRLPKRRAWTVYREGLAISAHMGDGEGGY